MTATGPIWQYIIDQTGHPVPVRISATIVSGLRRNIFSSVQAMNSGVIAILKTANPHIQFNNNISLLLNPHLEDKGLRLYELFLRALGSTIETTPTPPQQNGVSERKDIACGNVHA